VFQGISGGDMFASRAYVDDIVSLGNDMDVLIQKNQCGNAGLKRFEKNLYRFAERKAPLVLPGKETLADVRSIYLPNFDTKNVDFSKLLDDLIAENSKGWAVNRYIRGSVSNVSANRQGSGVKPNRIQADYRISNMFVKKRYKGNVVLTFNDSIPECLYFSDAPKTCRHPSRKIINKYEKGHYLQ
jgi:hypothetical protein